MNFSIIAAISSNNVIGKDNGLPWHIPEDLKHFKKITGNNPCIMGYNTYMSLPLKFRPLPNRENIVITRKPKELPGAKTFTYEQCCAYCQNKNCYTKCFVIGGAQIYKLFLPIVSSLYLTKIHYDFEGNVLFPEVNFDEWVFVDKKYEQFVDRLSGKLLDISFEHYIRKIK